MSYVNAMRTAQPTLARGGVPSSLFSGRRIEVLSGYDKDPRKMSGYRRYFDPSETAYRPGAHSPRTTRVGMNFRAPSTVGTTTVIGGIDALRERNELYGVAGSRAPYARHAPRRAGLMGRIPMSETPAYQVFETAYARTGLPVLYSKFAALAGKVPNGMGQFDPIPAYARMGAASMISPPSPVGCLPGTPGCYADASGRANPGFRLPWWRTQNEGQAAIPYFDQNDSPLPLPAGRNSSPLSEPNSGDVPLPINAPGTVHSIDATGGSSYLPGAGYPNYMSPWGYSGSSERTPAERVLPSGHDEPLRAYEDASDAGHRAVKTFAIGAALVVAYLAVKAGGR